ncbi:GtrA family protein [Marinomonas sp. PE14-40]|uniref:GtrA family protein n=1 Tax=Marinomonas sp. PE14-40 TaxID=3060621 RepID=UPI003F66B528
MSSFYRFALVGGLGFIVDLSIYALLSLIMPPLYARAFAFWCAVTSNWYLNRYFTFATNITDESNEADKLKQWSLFAISSLIAFVPNMGIYYLMMQLGQEDNLQALLPIYLLPAFVEASLLITLWPYFALVPGIIVGMLVNFIAAKYWVFKPKAICERAI